VEGGQERPGPLEGRVVTRILDQCSGHPYRVLGASATGSGTPTSWRPQISVAGTLIRSKHSGGIGEDSQDISFRIAVRTPGVRKRSNAYATIHP
jgi:hypothetical protein